MLSFRAYQIEPFLKENELNRRKISLLYNLFVQHEIEKAMLSLSEEDRAQLDIPLFLQGIHVYQSSLSTYSHLLEDKDSKGKNYQDIIAMSSLVISKQLEDEGDFKRLRHFSGVYSVNEIAQYFKLFSQTQVQTTELIQEPLAFRLNSANHNIILGYNPEKSEWSFTNANKADLIYTSNTEEIAKLIFNAYSKIGLEIGFSQSSSNADITIFSTEIFCKAKDEKEYDRLISILENHEIWKKIHAITSDKLSLTDFRGESWLYHAVRDGQLKIVNLLLENGVDCDVARNDGIAPLHLAVALSVQGKSSEILNRLLESRANPNMQTKDGKTPLFFAAFSNDLKSTKALLHNGANADLATVNGTTPIFAAAQLENFDLVDLLLQHRADFSLSLYSSVESLRQTGISEGKEKEMEKLIKDKLALPEERVKSIFCCKFPFIRSTVLAC